MASKEEEDDEVIAVLDARVIVDFHATKLRKKPSTDSDCAHSSLWARINSCASVEGRHCDSDSTVTSPTTKLRNEDTIDPRPGEAEAVFC